MPVVKNTKKIHGKKNSALPVLARLLKKDGSLVTTGDTAPTITITEDFGSFTELVTAATGTVHNTPQGTPTAIDERWNYAQNGNKGFNWEYSVAETVFTQIGRYQAKIVHDDLVTKFEINISD